MKKSLLLISLLAAFGTASAASSVSLYGVLDASIGETKTTTTTPANVKTVTKNSSLVREGGTNGLSRSRFGIKGSEDLGMGLKGHFVLEQSADTSNSNFNQSARQTYVGLSGEFGELTLGRQYTPFYDTIEPLTNMDKGSTVFTVSSVGIKNTRRANSSIKYVSPSFSGLKVGLLGGSDSTSLTGLPESKKDVMGASLSYTDGRVGAALAYDVREDKTGSISTSKNETSGGGLSYDFGVAKVIASYTEQKETGAGFTGNITNKDTSFGVKLPYGAAYVMAGVGQNEMKDTRSNNLSGNASSKGNNAVLGLGYHLSKRTEAYARFAKMNEAKYKTIAGVANGSTKTESFGVGVRHTF